MNFIIAAVGGQGALFAARVLARSAMDNNLDVKASEVHGMSQRGGSVITHVRYGSRVASPIVEEGFADVVLAFELLEGARAVPFLKPGGLIVVNKYRINPLPVLTEGIEYPPDIVSDMEKIDATIIALDASSLAKESGNIRATNAVMMGCLAKRSEFSRDSWLQALKALSPEKSIQSNCVAFDKGFAF